MTDKQIIIDGEQCEYLRDTGLCRLTYCFTEKSYDCSMCNDNPNCYYKQLKAKEQECEELKIYIESNEQQVKEVETLVMDNDRLINELDQLKAENDNIKETFDSLFKVQYKLADNNKKLRQTLTEIKEFFNEECIICKENYINITGEICEECKYKDILQKISECEGNDEYS